MTLLGFAALLWPIHSHAASDANADIEVGPELKDLTWVGFQQYEEVSRVFVRTTDTAAYRVDEVRPDLVVLILENTQISIENHARALQTQHFKSPVTRIVPKVIEGPSPHVRIEIHLHGQVPFDDLRHDNLIALEFER